MLDLPDTLSTELIEVAQSGFGVGFSISTALLVGVGGIVVFMHLVNRGAGH